MENKNDDKHHHHILSDKNSLLVLICLLVFTVITVAASRFDFGTLNFPIALFIASVKALLVVLFFMGIKYDENENKVIFFSSIFFVASFFLLAGADIFYRHDNWRDARGKILKDVAGTSSVKKAWIPTDELKANGKTIFDVQCALCHGTDGAGNGPAAAALNPKPRNFHEEAGWKNGRKPSDVFMTLKNGLNTMPSFATLSIDDRWSLVHYVLSLGPKAPEASADDLKKAGVMDPSKDDGGMGGDSAKKIPVDFALERYVQGAK